MYDAVYLDKLTRQHLADQLADLVGLSPSRIQQVHLRTQAAVNVDVTDNVRYVTPIASLSRYLQA